jgi:hypothetical protein
MTAGSGVVHNEDVEPLGTLRILQLWMTLPSASRWAAPRFEHMALASVPVRRESGIEARVYSGRSGVVEAASHTFLPLTLIDVRLGPNAVFDQALPASYNGFLYPLEGDLVASGATPRRLAVGQIGWLEPGDSSTTVRLTAGTDGARVMLYAGERQNVPIVTHGPFVGETHADLVRVSRAYTEGRMPRVSELSRRDAGQPAMRDSGGQSFARAPTFRAVGLCGSRLSFRSSATAAPTGRCREQPRPECAFDQPRHVDIDIERRPGQRVTSRRNHD